MAAFDAGRIVATADLDRSPFQRGLQEAKREARTFADSKYSAKVGADTSEADRKVVDIRARLDRLSAQRINPKIDLEGANAAEARLAGLQAQIDALNRSGGGIGGGGGGLGGGRGGFLSRFPKGPGFMALGLGAALPMAGPLAGAALGGAASFLSPTVAGGVGLAAFAAGAKASFTTVGNDVKKLTQLQARYNAAVTDKQRAAVLRQEHQLWASLDPAQRQAVKNVQGLHGAWQRYQKALQPQSFRVLAEGAQIAEKGLRLLLPTAKGVGNEIGNLASSANTSLSKPFWRHFFHDFLAVEAPLAVHVLGTALGNTVGGIAQLSEKFAPLGHDLENFLLNTSGGFNKWTQGGGPTKFVAWVRREAPIVERDLTGLTKALAGVGKGLAPIGQVELKALGPILNFVGKLGNEHPAVITAVGTALLGVGAGLKVIAGVRGIQGILGGIGGLGRGGRGGGGVGGAIGKGAPVPVFVTNWAGGAGGGPIIGGGPAGEGGRPTTRGGRVARVVGVGVAVAASSVIEPGALDKADAYLRKHKELAKQFGVEQHAAAEDRSSLASLNRLLVQSQGVTDRAANAQNRLHGALSRVAAQAQIEGALIGGSLGRGLIQGVEALIPHANLAGKLLVASTVKSMRLAANAHSPSRETERLAVDMGLGLIVGWRKIAPQVNAAFAHGTTTGLKFIENAMAKGVAATVQRLANARAQLATDVSGRSGYIANLTSSYTGYANITGALNPNGSVGSVRGFLHARLAKLRQFVDILRKLQRRGLSPEMLQEIADQGPDGGIGLGQSILADGGISSLNRLQRQVDAYAGQGARIAGHAVYDPRIAHEERQVRELVAEVKKERQQLHDILAAIKANPHQFAVAIGAEFRGAQHRATAGGH